MDFIVSHYSFLLNTIFAVIALIYIITMCLCYDTDKRSYATQMFLTILNILLVVCSYLTDSVFLLVAWLICLCANGYTLRDIHDKNND